MKKIIIILTASSWLSCGNIGFAQTAEEELKSLVKDINAKLQSATNEVSENYLKPELARFDPLFAKFKDAKPEERGQILLMKAKLYLEVLGQPDKAIAALEQIRRDLPGTDIAAHAADTIAPLKQMAEQKKTSDALAIGTVFPDFNEKDLDGRPLSLARFKGKVVLVDFWATWCMPCVMELPAVKSTYDKYHAKGFEIIGISLDEERDTLKKFIQQREMPWPEYFDGLRWQNKLAVKYGVNSTPTQYLIGRDGKILAKQLRGENLQAAVAAALAKK